MTQMLYTSDASLSRTCFSYRSHQSHHHVLKDSRGRSVEIGVQVIYSFGRSSFLPTLLDSSAERTLSLHLVGHIFLSLRV